VGGLGDSCLGVVVGVGVALVVVCCCCFDGGFSSWYWGGGGGRSKHSLMDLF
jgi:hypothetical protein